MLRDQENIICPLPQLASLEREKKKSTFPIRRFVLLDTVMASGQKLMLEMAASKCVPHFLEVFIDKVRKDIKVLCP